MTKLHDKSRQILEAIAKGQSYDQILAENSDWTYRDIFAAAEEALALLSSGTAAKSYDERMQAIQHEHPRAYSAWKTEGDESLRRLFASGKHVKEIAALLYRQPGAIKSRLEKLGLKPRP
jgi:DNA-binding NarL/FixJ family response regulator